MTENILSNNKMEISIFYLNLYISLATILNSHMGSLVGKVKLAKCLFEENSTDEYNNITDELTQLGFDVKELDVLLTELTYSE